MKLLIQVTDDDSPLVPVAVRYEELIDAHDPMPRIASSPDDNFLLDSGGTTGMPKGVMFRLGSWTESFAAGALTNSASIR